MRMWSSASYDLGLTRKEFFAITPRQFDALQKRHRFHIESNELLFGQLTSWVANTGFRSTAKPTKHSDFMPCKWREKKVAEDKPLVVRRKRSVIANEIRNMMSFFGR